VNECSHPWTWRGMPSSLSHTANGSNPASTQRNSRRRISAGQRVQRDAVDRPVAVAQPQPATSVDLLQQEQIRHLLVAARLLSPPRRLAGPRRMPAHQRAPVGATRTAGRTRPWRPRRPAST
jgi:hypothetical protein